MTKRKRGDRAKRQTPSTGNSILSKVIKLDPVWSSKRMAILDGRQVRCMTERFPHRSHRVRIAAQVEILGHEIVTGGKLEAADKFFTAVKQIAPGIRIRAIIGGYRDNDTELSEDEARAVFEMAINRLAPVRL